MVLVGYFSYNNFQKSLTGVPTKTVECNSSGSSPAATKIDPPKMVKIVVTSCPIEWF